MRESRESTRATTKWRLTLAVAALAAATTAMWPSAAAGSAEVDALVELAETKPARHRKLMAVEALRKIDNGFSRTALEELAKSDDPSTAMAAIGALCREDFSGARDTLEELIEDSDCDSGVRCMALGAYLELRKQDGDSWSAAKSAVSSATSDNDDLDDMAKSVGRHLWGSEVDDE